MRVPRIVLFLFATCLLVAAEDTPGTLTFDLPCTLAGGEIVTVHVAYPTLADGTIDAVAAADVVYYQGWWNEKEFFRRGIFKTLAEQRLTVVGIFFDNKEDVEGERNALPVIEEALAITRQRLGLPDTKPFGCGHSSGATFINGIAAVRPAFFEAIVPVSGSLRDVPTGVKAPQVPTLLVFSYTERHRLDGVLAWTQDTRDAGWCNLLVASPQWSARGNPTWHHFNNQASVVGASHWLKAVADLRRRSGGILPAPTAWPQGPSQWMASTFEPWADGTTRPVPSLAIAEEFGAIHRTVTRTADPVTGTTLITVTPRLPAKRVVVIIPPESRSIPNAELDAYLASDSEAVAIAIAPQAAHPLGDVVTRVVDQHPELPVIVIQHGEDRLAHVRFPERVTPVVIEPHLVGTPGLLEIVTEGQLPPERQVPSIIACKGTFKTDDVRHQRFLMTAIRGGIEVPRSALATK